MKRASRSVLLAFAIMLAMSASVRADFGAIAYSPETGQWGYSYGFDCQEDSQNDALSRCNADDAQIAVWVENGWAALAVGDDGAWGWGWSSSSREDAEARALQVTDNNPRIACWIFSGR